MKPQSSKLQHQHREETTGSQLREEQAAARGFASVEEMLRFDARQTPVPESVRTRLAESVSKEPRTWTGSWWKRLLP